MMYEFDWYNASATAAKYLKIIYGDGIVCEQKEIIFSHFQKRKLLFKRAEKKKVVRENLIVRRWK